MIDKEQFLKAPMPEDIVALPGLGDVRVRGLSRAEAVNMKGIKDDVGQLECSIIHLGLVDPALTFPEIEAWYASAPAGLIDVIVRAVERLSGLSEEAPKRDVPAVRGRR